MPGDGFGCTMIRNKPPTKFCKGLAWAKTHSNKFMRCHLVHTEDVFFFDLFYLFAKVQTIVHISI